MKTIKIKTNVHEREIVHRELSDDEVFHINDISGYVYRTVYYKAPPYMRDELESFINEESYIYGMKFNGYGDIRGYLYHNVKHRAFQFIRDFYTSTKLNIRDTVMGDEGEMSLFDTLEGQPPELEEHFEMLKHAKEFDRKVAMMLYSGVSMQEIASLTGKGYSSIRRAKERLRKIAKEHYGEDVSRGYRKSKRVNNLPPEYKPKEEVK